MLITALYAGLLALIAVFLVAGVGVSRTKAGVSLGDGGNEALIVSGRRHMNFVENVPLALILLTLIEINGAPKEWIHGLGGALVLGRIIHPFGLNMQSGRHPARGIGALLSMLVLLISAGIAIWQVASTLT